MKGTLSINFVGDICFHGIIEDKIEIDESILQIFRSADLNCGNLESPLTNSENKLKGQPIYLKGVPKNNLLFDIFDIYSLANNHIMDYGLEGLKETEQFLRNSNKYFFGAGLTRDAAEKPIIVEHKGFKLGFIGFTRYNEAKRNKPGTAPYKINRVCQIVRKLKKEGCFVIVMPHWNYQWVDYPSPFDWRNGHKIINAGADIIVGAHPHILQGIEVYKGKYIFHSLGNFLFKRTKYSKESEKLGKTIILNLTIKPDFSYEIKEHFIHSDGLFLNLLNETEIAKVSNHLKSISNPLSNSNELSRMFYKNSLSIDKNTNFVFKEMKKEHGWGSVIRDLMNANRQDIKKRAFSLYAKYFTK